MTFAPFSQEGRGAGWEIGENFKGKKPWAQSDWTKLAARHSRLRLASKLWHPTTISKLLTNPAYKGGAVFGKTRVGGVVRACAPLSLVRRGASTTRPRAT